MSDCQERCLGFECETAKHCGLALRHRHPHDILFMPAEKGTRCHSYDPLREEEGND